MPSPDSQTRLLALELQRIKSLPDAELEKLCSDPAFAWLKGLSDTELRRLLATPTPRGS